MLRAHGLDALPPVPIESVPEADRHRFRARKRMVDAFLYSSDSVARIEKRHSMSRAEIYRHCRRLCLALPGGLPAGYLVCVPQLKLAVASPENGPTRRRAGVRTRFFDAYPQVKTTLDDYIDRKKGGGHGEFHAKSTPELWRVFVQACRDADIDTSDGSVEYPFSGEDRGYAMLRTYARERRGQSFELTAKLEYGRSAGRLAARADIDAPGFESKAPYSRVVFDGHRLDTQMVVRVVNAEGEHVALPAVRPWILVALDVCSRAVLGYSLCVTSAYSMQDVLACFASVYEPWVPRKLPPGVAYPPGGGLPSGLVDRCAYRAMDQVRFDNDLSHVSPWLQDRLLASGVMEIVTSAVRSPHSNPIIERVFATLEASSFHRWPMTTGTGPRDPRRNDPEKAAVALEFDFEDLACVVDLCIAKYNTSTHEHLADSTPLQFLARRIARGADIVRHVARESVDGLGLFERDHALVIRGNAGTGHHPYVKYSYVRYTGPELAGQPGLIGQRATLRLDVRDIRAGSLYLGNRFLGRVRVPARWRMHRHGVVERRAIQKLIRTGRVADRAHDPVGDYYAYVERRAKTSRDHRSQLLRARIEDAALPSDPVVDHEPVKSERATYQPPRLSLSKTFTK